MLQLSSQSQAIRYVNVACLVLWQVGTIFQPLVTYEMPPTYFATSKVTSCFQEIVDAYGIARYREANPAVRLRCLRDDLLLACCNSSDLTWILDFRDLYNA